LLRNIHHQASAAAQLAQAIEQLLRTAFPSLPVKAPHSLAKVAEAISRVGFVRRS